MTIEKDERLGLASASSMHRIVSCPGSPAAERGLPELPTEQVTEDGNVVHDIVHTGDDDGATMTQKEIAGRLKEIEQRETAVWLSEFSLSPGPVYREVRLWIRNPVTLELLASAKPDYFVVKEPYALAIDFKSGYKDTTPAERNWQVRTQAVAIKQNYPGVSYLRGAIAASRLWTKFDSVDYRDDDLARSEHEIEHAVWRSQQPDAPRVPGPHCRYCRAQGLCRENATYAMIVHCGLPITKNVDQLGLIERVGHMTPQELAFVFQRKTTVEAIYKSVEARLKQLPKAELESVGYKLVPGNKNKEIVNVAAAFQRLGTVLTEEERLQCLSITRGRAEEILAEKEHLTGAAAKEKILQALGDSIIDKPGNPKLKPL